MDEAASNGTLVHTFLSHDPDNEEYELQKSRGLPVHQRKQGVYQLLIKNDKELPFILYENQYLIKRGVSFPIYNICKAVENVILLQQICIQKKLNLV